jgi:hypothetical protein
VQTSKHGTFLSIYNLKLDPEVTPCDTLFARVYREMKRGQLSVIPLIKIKTMAQTAPIMQTTKKQRISETMSITLQEKEELTDVPIENIAGFLRAHKVLMYSSALIGTQEKDSKRKPGTSICEADLPACLNYHEFCHTQCLLQRGSAHALTQWMVDRDHQTRVQARVLHSEGWPFGEALREAREKHLAVLWTVGPSQDRPPLQIAAQAEGMTEHPPGKRSRPPVFDPGSLTRAQCCDQWNSSNRCECKQKDCPYQKLHRCTMPTPGGGICGVWNHSKTNHTEPGKRSPAPDEKVTEGGDGPPGTSASSSSHAAPPVGK